MYALRQLEGLAEKVERRSAIGDLAKAAKDTEPAVREWLAVLARCFQLSDAVAVLELQRVMESAPGDVEQHRQGIRAARSKRVQLIAETTQALMTRMDAAAGTANSKVLLHPNASRSVVKSSNAVSGSVVELRRLLGIEGAREAVEARRWTDAATDVKDKVVVVAADAKDKVFDVSAGGIEAAVQAGSETLDRAKSMAARVVDAIPKKSLHEPKTSEEQREGA